MTKQWSVYLILKPYHAIPSLLHILSRPYMPTPAVCPQYNPENNLAAPNVHSMGK